MSFKGTEHYRKIARLMDEHYGRNFYDKSVGMYVLAVDELCDELDRLSQVVEAARVLISPPNSAKDQRLTIIRTRDFDALQRAIGALETEEEGDG